MQIEDNLVEAGAARLAARITAYWRERGYPVRTWLTKETQVTTNRSSAYGVRSDMVNGLPMGNR